MVGQDLRTILPAKGEDVSGDRHTPKALPRPLDERVLERQIELQRPRSAQPDREASIKYGDLRLASGPVANAHNLLRNTRDNLLDLRDEIANRPGSRPSG